MSRGASAAANRMPPVCCQFMSLSVLCTKWVSHAQSNSARSLHSLTHTARSSAQLLAAAGADRCCRRRGGSPGAHEGRQLRHCGCQRSSIDVRHVSRGGAAVAGGVGAGDAPVQRPRPLRHVLVTPPDAVGLRARGRRARGGGRGEAGGEAYYGRERSRVQASPSTGGGRARQRPPTPRACQTGGAPAATAPRGRRAGAAGGSRRARRRACQLGCLRAAPAPAAPPLRPQRGSAGGSSVRAGAARGPPAAQQQPAGAPT